MYLAQSKSEFSILKIEKSDGKIFSFTSSTGFSCRVTNRAAGKPEAGSVAQGKKRKVTDFWLQLASLIFKYLCFFSFPFSYYFAKNLETLSKRLQDEFYQTDVNQVSFHII